MRSISPGFYVALSQRELVAEAPLIRLYWNIAAGGAETLVRSITAGLGDADCSFRLKVLNDPAMFDRCDAAVLYLEASGSAAISDVLGDVYRQVEHFLKPSIPALTRPAGRGVGFASDPGRNESFGQHRCRLLSDGLIHAKELGARSLSMRTQVVLDRFVRAGIDPEQPYRTIQLGSDFTYDLDGGRERR